MMTRVLALHAEVSAHRTVGILTIAAGVVALGSHLLKSLLMKWRLQCARDAADR
jgi:hypothetical protein